MAIFLVFCSFIFARQLGKLVGYAITAALAVVVFPLYLLQRWFRRWRSRNARQKAAKVERRAELARHQRPPEPPQVAQRQKATVIPLRPRKRL